MNATCPLASEKQAMLFIIGRAVSDAVLCCYLADIANDDNFSPLEKDELRDAIAARSVTLQNQQAAIH